MGDAAGFVGRGQELSDILSAQGASLPQTVSDCAHSASGAGLGDPAAGPARASASISAALMVVTAPPLGPCHRQGARHLAWAPGRWGLLACPKQLRQLCTLQRTVIGGEGAPGGERGRNPLASLPTLGRGFLGLEQSG